MTEQLSLLGRSAPDPHEIAYFGWAIDKRDPTPKESASAAFLRWYGRPPEFVIEAVGGLLLCGPIPEVT